MIIAIDFDGTIVENAFPAIGEMRSGAKKHIKKLRQRGYKIIISTCREGDKATEAKAYLEARNVPFDAFNENLPEMIELYGGDCRKISADIYVDDKDWRSFKISLPVWSEIYKEIIKKGDDEVSS